MTLIVPEADPHTEGIAAALEAALAIPVGRGRKPDGAGWQQPQPGPNVDFVAYAVVYGGGLADFRGSHDQPWEDVTAIGQVSIFALDDHGAQLFADQARAVLLDRTAITVADRIVSHVRPVTGPPVRRDDDTDPPVFLAVVPYAVETTPA